MAKGTVAKDTTEVVWLLFATLGVVVLTLIVHTAYKDIQKFINKVGQLFRPRKELKQKRRIMRLLHRHSDEDLAKIVFSLSAWPREGLPDKDLFIARPPHYRGDLKFGSRQVYESDTDPALCMEYLTRNTRENLLVILDAKLDNRSYRSLKWLELCLTSGEDLEQDRNKAQSA